ncbi:MAG: glycoside hydrolase family 125 protein [Treponema sp.]|nr:glycoside hydrolase family 125 protein [Treponema sp.]
MGERYFVTGNELVSLPTIRESDGALEGISFLHMGSKGMIELCGNDTLPLLCPFVEIDGKRAVFEKPDWQMLDNWIPRFSAAGGPLVLRGEILAPLGERGFAYKLGVKNSGGPSAKVRFGLSCHIGRIIHTVNESKPIAAKGHIYKSAWNGAFVFDARIGVPLFAFAPIFSPETLWEYTEQEDGIDCRLYGEKTVGPAESAENVFWFGLGFEEVAAATSAKEMLRQGYDAELAKTRNWLQERSRTSGDDKLDAILNRNLLFSFFFGSGRTLDTDEFVLVTSRSPRYYVSAAYWDRDSLLWAFPAILLTDRSYAREILRYVFTRQIQNVGIHSRYIDGTVLEPGFELDELCAPVIALKNYLDARNDERGFSLEDELSAADPVIERGVKRILSVLREKRGKEIALYETMLQPTDDMRVYPYLTYDNVLVWKALLNIADMYEDLWPKEITGGLRAEAGALRQAVFAHCVKEYEGKNIFAWSVDLHGRWDLYDEPPGSLLLLPHYGFCSQDDGIWRNTAAVIRRSEYPYSFAGSPIAEIGCPHAPHPWVLSIANSMLCGHGDRAKKHLLLCEMDNGIACESVDENSGKSVTGDAFATCAGFLAYAVYKTFGK